LLRNQLFAVVKKFDSAEIAQHASDAQQYYSDFIVSDSDYL